MVGTRLQLSHAERTHLDEFRVALADALRPLSDPVVIKAQASRLLAERLGAQRVAYFEVRDSDYWVESDFTRGVPSLAGAHPVSSLGQELFVTLLAGRTAICADIELEPTLSDAERAAFRSIQVGAQIGVPLVKEGRFVAGLAVHCAERRDWLLADVAIAEECAERTWATVERARAEREQRASDERYRRLFESIDEGFCVAQIILDQAGAPRDYRFIEANKAFERHTGLVDAVGKTIRELVPDLEEFWFRTYGKVALTGESIRCENYAPAMQRFFDVYCSRVGPPEELKVAILFQDITQRKQAEEALRESEARFRALVAMSSDWYWEQDEHFRYVHISNEVEVRAGVQAHSHIGKTRWELAHAGVSEEHWAEHRALLERHEPFRGFAFQRINERGEAIWASASGDPVFDADGRFKGYRGTGTDITERKRAEEALRESEERFRTLADHMSQLAWMADEKGWIFWYNRRWYEYTGTTLEEMQGWGWKQVHHPEHVERVVVRIQHSWDTGEVWEDTFPLRGRDGRYRWFLSRAVPIRDAAGRVLRWFGTNTDITEQREAEAALKQADRRKDEFIATLSHELRNPLAPLRNGLELLRMQGANGELTPIREMMERQLNQLVRLVDDLLEMSRISRGAFELRNERVELGAVVTNAIETSDPLITAARHELSVSLPEKPLWIEGDPVRLAQIVANLLNNAANYTAPGGRIKVRAQEQDGMATVSVTDNGDGIAADLLPGVFEIFSRGRQSAGREAGGLGIGLAISRKLADMHGGTLNVTSDGPGKGSEFTLRLPLVVDTGKAKAGNEPVLAAVLPQQRILVVDDNRDAAESLQMVLALLGAEVRVANDGPQALETFEAYRPEVVLLDIGMPGMDGYEVARLIRAKHPEPRAAIIALSGWGQEDDRRRSREAGFDHHLVKPADIGLLRALLASLPSRPEGVV